MKWCRVYKCWYRDIKKIKVAIPECSRNCEKCEKEDLEDERLFTKQ